jgi:transposase
MDFHMQRRQGLSIRKIAALNGVSRNAVRRALRSLTPPDGRRQRSQGDKLAPFHEQIATWLRDPVKSHWTGARILDELEDRGYEGGRTVLMDYLRRVRPKPAAQAEARFYVKPGQQAQIDWADMGPVPVDGVMTKVYVFVAILSWSRTLFVRFTTDMQLLTWLDCHRRAFEYFGGVTREVLIDNLKTGVDSRAGGTVRWNSKYQELAVALGFTPLAHFPKRPKTKGRVERIVSYTRSRFFVGRDVINLDRLNDDAIEWLAKRANRRVHRVTAQRPCDRLTTERASLMPLVAFEVMLEENRVADAYALVSCDGVRYSVPPRYARQAVVMQRRPDGVTFVVDGAVLVRHAWAKPGVRLVQLPEHLPPKPRPRHERFVSLGDRVTESFGELGRRYVDAVERRAPHAPLAILREVCEREAEFGRPIVAAVIENLLHFKVIKRGTLSRLCYRFGTLPKLDMTVPSRLPDITVERRDLALYDGPAA